MTEELWRNYKGATAEDLCAAIRELWLAKSPNYIRMLNEVPNKLIAQEAAAVGPNPKEDWCDDTTGRPLTPSEKENMDQVLHQRRTVLHQRRTRFPARSG